LELKFHKDFNASCDILYLILKGSGDTGEAVLKLVEIHNIKSQDQQVPVAMGTDPRQRDRRRRNSSPRMLPLLTSDLSLGR
jgi:hypothetical protein